MTPQLHRRVEEALARPVIAPVRAFAEMLGEQDNALAVLFYGSNLRTGSLEGVLDFYVLREGAAETGIWPRVSYHEWDWAGDVHTPATTLRAKVATMTLATFHQAASGALLDTTIWARFVQPSAIAWQRSDAAGAKVRDAIAAGAMTAARLAVALGPGEGPAEKYWRALFQATYRAELRVEKAGREESIISADPEHYRGLLPIALEAAGIACPQDGDVLRPQLDKATGKAVLHWWRRRQRLGKPYNLVRLIKASTTFEGAARYAAWKVERHTGIPVKLTPWRERHPLLAAPAVLVGIWRERARRARREQA